MKWKIFVEVSAKFDPQYYRQHLYSFPQVPVPTTETTPKDSYKIFLNLMPCFKFFGTEWYIDPQSPYDVQCSAVPDEVQLVCKYLRAFYKISEDGKREIDRLYPNGKYEY